VAGGVDSLGDIPRQARPPCSLDETGSPRELLDRLADWARCLPGVEHVSIEVNQTDEDSQSQGVLFSFQNRELGEWLQKNADHWAALVGGQHVILTSDASPGSEQRQPGSATLLLVPLVSNSVLQAVLRLEVRDPARMPPPQMLDSLFGLCRDIAPIVSWMRCSGAIWPETSRAVGEAGNPERVCDQLPKERCQPEQSWQTSVEAFANIVHDLRDPLVAVRGYAKMLLEEKSGRINERQREELATILANTQRMVTLLNGLSRLVADWQLRLDPPDVREWRKPPVWSGPTEVDR